MILFDHALLQAALLLLLIFYTVFRFPFYVDESSMDLDLAAVNAQLKDKSPVDIIRWALGLNERVMASTSFGHNSALMLHLVSQTDASIPVVWVDHGYNVKDAYLTAHDIENMMSLNLKVYTPQMTAERRNALMGGIPHVDEPEKHAEFTRQIKLEPFARALKDIQPKIWITGIRRDDTAHRESLDIVSYDARGLLKVAPIFYWNDEQVATYMAEHNLPSCKHYFDPSKVHDHRECGLHTLDFTI